MPTNAELLNSIGQTPAPEPIPSAQNPAIRQLDLAYGRPEWFDESRPLENRLAHASRAFSEAGIREGHTFEQVREGIRRHFPEANVEPMRRAYDQERSLDQARRRFAGREPNQLERIVLESVPFVSSIGGMGMANEYNAARRRFNEGKPEEGDYTTIARFERLQDIQQHEGTGQQIERGLRSVPAMLGEAYLGGGVVGRGVSALGATAAAGRVAGALGTRGAAAAGYAGNLAATTAAMPSMYAPQWAQRNLENNREPYSLDTLPSTFAHGMMATAVLGSLGRAGNSITTNGVRGVASRLLTRTATGMVEQQGIDVMASAISEVLPKAYKIETGYGLLGQGLRGEWGPMAQHAIVQAVTFAAFSGVHELTHGRPLAGERATGPQTMQEGASRQFGLSDLVTPGQPQQLGLVRRGGPLETPQAQRVPTPSAFEGVPAKVIQALGDHLRQSHENEVPRTVALRQILEIGNRFRDGLAENQSMDREAARTIFAGMPEGTLRDFAMSLAETRPGQQEGPRQAIGWQNGPRVEPRTPPGGLEPLPPMTPEQRKAWEAYQGLGLSSEAARRKALAASARPPEGPTPPPAPPVAPEPPKQTSDPVVKAGAVFGEHFGDKVVTTGRPVLRAETKGHWFEVSEGQHPDSVRIDFGWPGERTGRARQAGDQEVIRSELLPLIRKLKETGVNIEYVAIGGRERGYAALLNRGGYEQISGPTGPSGEPRVWSPKGPEAVAEKPVAVPEPAKPSRFGNLDPKVEAVIDNHPALKGRDKERDALKAVLGGATFEQAAELAGLKFKQSAEQNYHRALKRMREADPKLLQELTAAAGAEAEATANEYTNSEVIIRPGEQVGQRRGRPGVGARTSEEGGGEKIGGRPLEKFPTKTFREAADKLKESWEAHLADPTDPNFFADLYGAVRFVRGYAGRDPVKDIAKFLPELKEAIGPDGIRELIDHVEDLNRVYEAYRAESQRRVEQPQALRRWLAAYLQSGQQAPQVHAPSEGGRAPQAGPAAGSPEATSGGPAVNAPATPAAAERGQATGNELKPEHVQQFAAEIAAQDRAWVDERNAMLREARQQLRGYGADVAHIRRYAEQDATAMKAIDVVADSVARRYPGHFDNRSEASDQLFDMLQQGNLKRMSPEEAHRQAVDQIESSRASEQERSRIREEAIAAGGTEEQADRLVGEVENETLSARRRQDAESPEGESAGQAEAAGGAGGRESSATDLPFGANEPVAGVGREPGGPRVAEDVTNREVAQMFEDGRLKQIGGGQVNQPVLNDLVQRARRFMASFVDGVRELAGAMAPRTTRLSPEAGDAVSRFNAAGIYARELTPHLIDQVMGEKATQADRMLIGQVMTERRLRHMRQVFLGQSREASNAAANARAAGLPAAEFAQQATDAMIKAREVKTVIGRGLDAADSPLMSEADYQAALQNPKVQEAIKRFNQFVVPIMEKNYRAAQGLEHDDPINSPSQIPNEPINLKAVRENDPRTPGLIVTVGKKGEPTNPKAKKFGFAKKATGAGEGYDVDLGAIIEHSIGRGTSLAAQAEMYRTLVDKGLAKWDKPGTQHSFSGEAAKELKEVKPPAGTQEAQKGQTSLYLDPRVYGEVRQALQIDQPATRLWGTGLLTKASLASTVEAAYHSKNLLTFLFKPGVSPIDLVKNVYGVMSKDKETAARLVELARIGVLKEKGMESGMLWGGKTDPTSWMSSFLHVLDRSMRLTGGDAFERLQRQGRVVGSESNKRDFVNQLGQYNSRAQNWMVKWLRETGLGPFATAGTNYYMQGLQSLTLHPGVKASSFGHAVGLRAEMLLKTVAVLSAVPIINYLAWGRVDGDDNTPIGGIKVGTSGGRTSYLDLTALTGITRGARETGLLALAEGNRLGARRMGTTGGDVLDRAVHDAAMSALHPAFGPPVAFANTALTGRNTLGTMVAHRAKPGEGQSGYNLAAAFWQANPVISALTGMDHPGQEVPLSERTNKLLGPFGLKNRMEPPGSPHRTLTINQPTPEQRRQRQQLGLNPRR